MDILDNLELLASKLRDTADSIKTEEATKNALIMPFLSNVLGYDVFDPKEVIPEFVCDLGTKKGEKIDYAILKDGAVQILIECKKSGEDLNITHASQLFRYFHVTNARIAVLCNGRHYWFFTDLDAPNKMDEKPFLILDILNIDQHTVPELKKLTRSDFDLESVINAAGELKYIGQLKKHLAEQMTSPDDDFVRHFTTRVYEGVVTQKVREQFSQLLKKAITQYKSDLVNDRLKSAITQTVPSTRDSLADAEKQAPDPDAPEESALVVTTAEELEGFFAVKSIVRTVIDPRRVGHRDNQNYFAILVDDNNRKPICRLHLNRSNKYIGLFDDQKNEVRHIIQAIDDIYAHADHLKATALRYQA